MTQPGLKGTVIIPSIRRRSHHEVHGSRCSSQQRRPGQVEEPGLVTRPFSGRVVFKKTHPGGYVTDITTGPAPINKVTLGLANVIFYVRGIEGWGMTENCAAGSRTLPNDWSGPGTVDMAQPYLLLPSPSAVSSTPTCISYIPTIPHLYCTVPYMSNAHC